MAAHAKRERISVALARRLALRGQLLFGAGSHAGSKEGTARIIEELGYVQIDTISVVNRAHHHTLWTRQPRYHPDLLFELQSKDRRVFEYWGHAASYLPMKDYRYYLPMMRSFPWDNEWIKRMYRKHKDVIPRVLRRIRTEGPLGSAAFKAPDEKKRGAWWNWKPAKTALELLLWRGDLMVTERRNFQRIYELTERVLPDSVDTSVPDPEEVARFRVRRALAAHGISTRKEVLDHLHISAKARVPNALEELLDSGEVIPTEPRGLDGSVYYALRDVMESASRLRKRKARLHILSPFDNMIIHRYRIEQLFGFSYMLECYTPAAKRKYGYYVMPLLWGEEFVGRLDPKADRKAGKLLIRNLAFEPGFNDYDRLLPWLAEKLKALAAFNNCRQVSVEKATPARTRTPLRKLLGA